MPRTDHRFQVTIATVQLAPTELQEGDFRLPADEFRRLAHANERCAEGKLMIHRAKCLYEQKDGLSEQGAMQSAMFDIDRSNGRAELKELLDAIRQTVLDKFYDEPVSGIIQG